MAAVQETIDQVRAIDVDQYKYGFETQIESDKVAPGLNEDVIRLISSKKQEPEWLLEFRLKAYRHWLTMQEPDWALVDYPKIDFQDIVYYSAPKQKKQHGSLDEVDPELLRTFEKLGIPLSEQKMLANVAVDVVFDSVSVTTTYKEKLAEAGVIFCSISEAIQKHPEIVKKYLGRVVPPSDNFYAALNSAGAYKLPLILCVVNNGWAISVPRSAQTGAQTLAQKGLAGGLFCLQVDGNDLVAVLEAMRQARERALAGEGGTVLEFLTYRLSDHTTADDARRYRGEQEVKDAWVLEPMLRLRSYLVGQGLWSEAHEDAWKEECAARVDEEVNAYLNTPVQPVEAMFDYLYADPPPDLLAQRAQALSLEQRHG